MKEWGIVKKEPWFAAILLLAVTSACSSTDASTGDGSTVIPMQVFYFASLPQMVATSDLIVVGTVQTVEPGRVLGEDEAAIQFVQITLSVDQVLLGQFDAKSVVLEEFGLEGNQPSQVGDHGVYFLHQKTDAPEFYRLINTQGRFLDNEQGGLVALDDESWWVKVIESKSLSELVREIQAAARDVAAGRVKPAKPSFG